MKWNAVVFTGIMALAGIPGCKDNDQNATSGYNNPPNPSPNTVTMQYNAFSPATITVAVNTTITWRNNDGTTHTSTSDSTGWDTGDIAPGASRTSTFNTRGTFRYHCTYHRAMGMTGTVVVQ
jgi:plastocyanin